MGAQEGSHFAGAVVVIGMNRIWVFPGLGHRGATDGAAPFLRLPHLLELPRRPSRTATPLSVKPFLSVHFVVLVLGPVHL
jgi:hypothetical protein